jgi:hypothetical protein
MVIIIIMSLQENNQYPSTTSTMTTTIPSAAATTKINTNPSIFCKQILQANRSIRFAALANNLGSLIATEYRQGLIPLMTKEQTSQYAIEAVLRAAIREEFESDIGRLEYSIGKYEKLIRATIPIISIVDNTTNAADNDNDTKNKKLYLLLSFDIDSDARTVIDTKILPYIKENKMLLV